MAYAKAASNSRTPSLEDYAKFIDWASKSGFKGFELAAFTNEHLAKFEKSSELRKLKEKYVNLGIPCDAFEAGLSRFGIVDPSEEVRKRALKDFSRAVNIARQLDTEVIYAHSAYHPSWKIEWRELYDEFSPPSAVLIPSSFSWVEAWEDYARVIGKYTDETQKAGLRFALEIRPFEMVTNADSMMRLINSVGSKSLGVVFDTAHFFVQKEILPIAIEKLKGHIFLVHLADNDGINDYHWAPGKGKIHWPSVLEALKKIEYKGFMNIDVAGMYNGIGVDIKFGQEYLVKLL